MTALDYLRLLLMTPGDDDFKDTDHQFDILYARLIDEIEKSGGQFAPDVIEIAEGQHVEVAPHV